LRDRLFRRNVREAQAYHSFLRDGDVGADEVGDARDETEQCDDPPVVVHSAERVYAAGDVRANERRCAVVTETARAQ